MNANAEKAGFGSIEDAASKQAIAKGTMRAAMDGSLVRISVVVQLLTDMVCSLSRKSNSVISEDYSPDPEMFTPL